MAIFDQVFTRLFAFMTPLFAVSDSPPTYNNGEARPGRVQKTTGGIEVHIVGSTPITVSNVDYAEPDFEINRTGLWQSKSAYTVTLIGRKIAPWTAGAQNDLVETGNAVIPEMDGTEALEIVSTNPQDNAAGTGAHSVRVTYIDALAGNAQTSAVVVPNGTTPVAIGAGVRASAIQCAEVMTAGSLGVAAGDISIRRVTVGTVYEFIRAGGNASMSGRYMVPAGYSAYAHEWNASAIGQEMDIRLRATVGKFDRSTNTSTYLFQDATYPGANQTSGARHLSHMKFPSGCKLKMSALPGATTGSPRCEASISLVLISN